MTQPKDQLEATPHLRAIAASMADVRTPDDLGRLRDQLHEFLVLRPYNDAAREHELSIRWRQTAHQILTDGYVYEKRGCTDLVIAFLGLCRAKGLPARFVKVSRNGGKTHSVAEVEVDGTWWIVEVVAPGMPPTQGEITEDKPYRGWQLWKKGPDAWSIGLAAAADIGKVLGADEEAAAQHEKSAR